MQQWQASSTVTPCWNWDAMAVRFIHNTEHLELTSSFDKESRSVWLVIRPGKNPTKFKSVQLSSITIFILWQNLISLIKWYKFFSDIFNCFGSVHGSKSQGLQNPNIWDQPNTTSQNFIKINLHICKKSTHKCTNSKHFTTLMIC